MRMRGICLMKILYFAWLKEHTGQSSEELQLPDGVDTVGALIPHITKQSPGHKAALANLDAVRVAVNRVYGDGPNCRGRPGVAGLSRSSAFCDGAGVGGNRHSKSRRE